MITTAITLTLIAWGDWGWFIRFQPPPEFYVLVWVSGAVFFLIWALWDWATDSSSSEDKEAYYDRAREWERHLREDGTDD